MSTRKQSNINSFFKAVSKEVKTNAEQPTRTLSFPSVSGTSEILATNAELPTLSSVSGTSGTFTTVSDNSDSELEKDLNSSQNSENSESEQNTNHIKKKRKLKNLYIQKCRSAYIQHFSSWLVSKDGNSFCKFCQKFIVGGYSHLSRHANNAIHKKKENAIKFTMDIKQYKTKIDEKKVLSKKVKECELKLAMLIIEHNLPFILMEHLPKLLLSAAPDSEILRNVNCSRTKTTCMLKNFQEESERNILCALKQVKFFVIVDETTDVSVKKCLAILVRYTDLQLEKVRDRLLALVEVDDLSAEGILQKILFVINNLSIPQKNLIGFAADNASVMMGKFNGVQAKLRDTNPNIVVIGCICHSLHLCASAAAEKLPKQIEDFVRDIYNYLNCSSKRIGEYKEFQEYVRLKPHKLLRPSQTRWLSLEAVVKRTLEQWPALLLYFNAAVLEDNLVAASTIHNALNNIIYKLYLTFLAYILPIITKLNLEFQAEKPQIHNMYDRIQTITKSIFKNF